MIQNFMFREIPHLIQSLGVCVCGSDCVSSFIESALRKKREGKRNFPQGLRSNNRSILTEIKLAENVYFFHSSDGNI